MALVIGNENYTNLSQIPSAKTDGELMKSRLDELGFDVYYRRDVETLYEFQHEVLPEFRKKLDPGAFVIFYFSGHGFGYGSDNFLAPTEIPLSIEEDEVTSHAISVENVKSLIESHSPGLVLLILDACRSIPGFVVSNKRGENIVGKGLGEMLNRNVSVNSFVAYATKPGTSARGFSEPGRPSIFTEALGKYIRAKGQSFRTVFDEVAADVRASTNEEQIPGKFDWSQTDPYLNPTPYILSQQKEAWLGAREKKQYVVIRVYSYRNSVSRHAAAALKWLFDNSKLQQSNDYSRASPSAIDRAWRPNNEDRVSVRRLAIPSFGFTRSVEESQNVTLRNFSDQEIGLVPAWMSRKRISKLATLKEYLARLLPGHRDKDLSRDSLAFSLANIDAHGTTVATQNLIARREPSGSAPVIRRIPVGTQLEINGLTWGPNESIWLSASSSGDSQPFYLEVEPGTTPLPLDLGRSLKEIMVQPRPYSIPELVDPRPITQALKELKKEGWTITWASLSSAATDDKVEQEIRAARIANAEYILKRAGIDGRRITSVSGRDDFSGSTIRVRFYGIR